MNCREIDEKAVIDRYLDARLDETERQDFEDHYFGCTDCFEQLRIARMLQAKPERHQTGFRTFLSAPSRRLVALLPAAALVVAFLFVTLYGNWRSSRTVPIHQVTDNVVRRSPVDTNPGAERETLISQLARVDPPPYVPARLRETDDQARAQFDRAMYHYRRGDYVAATQGLEIAARLTPAAVDVNFYLGACYLLTNQPEKAVDALHKAISPNASDFAEQAHYYLAKAYLQEHNLASARTELELTLKLHGAREGEARKLRQELDELQ